jgi:hypothetical protein
MINFLDDIQIDIDERKDILLTTKVLPYQYSFTEKDKQFFFNYSVLIIYATWEGFVQQTFQSYVRELNSLALDKALISDSILTFTFENTFKQIREYPDKESKKVKLISGLDTFFQDRILNIPAIINTQSNVSFEVINDLLATFNLYVFIEYLVKYKLNLKNELRFFIDHHRNPIAHGNIGGIVVTQDNINRFIILVEILMDEVFERVKQGYISRTYLKIKPIS